jgi:alpha-tubulin suppressor-like RCC1 family protein
VRGWGTNHEGELAETPGDPEYRVVPGPEIAALPQITSLHVGGETACAVTATGGLKCWGNNLAGQLGAGLPHGYVGTPTDVVGLASGVETVDISDHLCAIQNGALWCWGGYNSCGEIGDGFTNNQPEFPAHVDLGARVLDVAAGGQHTCAIVEGGGVKCWGCNIYGELGIGVTSQTPSLAPVDVVGLGGPARAIEAGLNHTCVLLTAGAVQCWGRSIYGQTGGGHTLPVQPLPGTTVGMDAGVAQLSTGGDHTCALKDDGTVWCWGGMDGKALNGDFGVPTYVPSQANLP